MPLSNSGSVGICDDGTGTGSTLPMYRVISSGPTQEPTAAPPVAQGAEWVPRHYDPASSTTSNVRAMAVSADTGFVVIADGDNATTGKIFGSRDGGITWERMYTQDNTQGNFVASEAHDAIFAANKKVHLIAAGIYVCATSSLSEANIYCCDTSMSSGLCYMHNRDTYYASKYVKEMTACSASRFIFAAETDSSYKVRAKCKQYWNQQYTDGIPDYWLPFRYKCGLHCFRFVKELACNAIDDHYTVNYESTSGVTTLVYKNNAYSENVTENGAINVINLNPNAILPQVALCRNSHRVAVLKYDGSELYTREDTSHDWFTTSMANFGFGQSSIKGVMWSLDCNKLLLVPASENYLVHYNIDPILVNHNQGRIMLPMHMNIKEALPSGITGDQLKFVAETTSVGARNQYGSPFVFVSNNQFYSKANAQAPTPAPTSQYDHVPTNPGYKTCRMRNAISHDANHCTCLDNYVCDMPDNKCHVADGNDFFMLWHASDDNTFCAPKDVGQSIPAMGFYEVTQIDKTMPEIGDRYDANKNMEAYSGLFVDSDTLITGISVYDESSHLTVEKLTPRSDLEGHSETLSYAVPESDPTRVPRTTIVSSPFDIVGTKKHGYYIVSKNYNVLWYQHPGQTSWTLIRNEAFSKTRACDLDKVSGILWLAYVTSTNENKFVQYQQGSVYHESEISASDLAKNFTVFPPHYRANLSDPTSVNIGQLLAVSRQR